MRNCRISSEDADAFIATAKDRDEKERKKWEVEYQHRKKDEEKSTGLILAQIEKTGAVLSYQNGYVFNGSVGDWNFSLCNQSNRIVGDIHFQTDDPNDLWVIRECALHRLDSDRIRELYGFRSFCYDGKAPGVYYEFLNRLIHDETRLLEELDKH